MKTVLTTVTFLVAATSAVADPMASVIAVEPRYEIGYVNTPVNQCQDVEVPVYGTVQGGGNAGEGALAGMIIGGILGKGVSGNNDGAAAGAVIGGIIGANNAQNGNRRVVTGYRTERQCSQVMQTQEQRRVRDYLITYEWRGFIGQSYTYNNYYVGQQIPVEVTILAK